MLTKKKHHTNSYSVDTVKLGHLEEDCPITTFSENKRFSSFCANRPIKLKYSTMQLLKT